MKTKELARALKPIEIMGVTHEKGKIFEGEVTHKNGRPQFAAMIGLGGWAYLELGDEVELA